MQLEKPNKEKFTMKNMKVKKFYLLYSKVFPFLFLHELHALHGKSFKLF